MNIHDATETAYKNGYKAGYEKGLADSCKHGNWVSLTVHDMREANKIRLWFCSLCEYCGGNEEKRLTNFCPYCGARMD